MLVGSWWSERTVNEQWALGLGGLAFLVAVGIAAVWVTMERYEPLFNGLTPQEVTEVANQLTQDGIEYRLDQDAGRVLVTKSDVQKARATIIEHGLPLGKLPGFELFNDIEFGMTDFTQRINYQRALEGELARTIASLHPVQHARIHLVLPQTGLFAKDGSAASASVVLVLKEGAHLAHQQVSGVRGLLASAIPGLRPANVTLHDQAGVSLVRSSPSDADVEGTDTWLGTKKGYERYYQEKVSDIVSYFVGARAHVQVNVELDHGGYPIRHTTWMSAPRSETALPVQPESLPGATEMVSLELSESLDSDVDRQPVVGGATKLYRFSNGRAMPGTPMVGRLTISVMLPGVVDDAFKEALRLSIDNAVGLRHERGDAISIVESNASQSQATDAVPTSDSRTHFPGWLSGLSPEVVFAIGIGVLLLLLGAVALVIRAMSSSARLADPDREALLNELRTWISQGEEVTRAQS